MKIPYVCGGHIFKLLGRGECVLAAQLPVIGVERWADAERAGWTMTTDIKWSPDGQLVYLCPECAKEHSDDTSHHSVIPA